MKTIQIVFFLLISISLTADWKFSSREDVGGIPAHIISVEADNITAFVKPVTNLSDSYITISGKNGSWKKSDSLIDLPKLIRDIDNEGKQIVFGGQKNSPDERGNGIFILENDDFIDISVKDKYGEIGQIDYDREYLRIKTFNGITYILAHAYRVAEYVYDNGVHTILRDTTYNELWKLENGELQLICRNSAEQSLHAYDFVKDKNGDFWFCGLSRMGLMKWDGQFSMINTHSKVFPPNDQKRRASYIVINSDTLTVLYEYDNFAPARKEARFIFYEINTSEVKTREIPEFRRSINDGTRMLYEYSFFDDFNIIDNTLFIQHDRGITTYNGIFFEDYDILENVGDYVSTSFHKSTYLEDFYLDGRNLVVSTNWGILTNDDFDFTTSVEEAKYKVDDFLLYPSNVGYGESVTIEAPEGLKIDGIRMISMEGRNVEGLSTIINGTNATIKIPALATGLYAAVIETAEGIYIKEIMVD
jgi:hypothetical protein